jgi:uncharacterized Ntn-hydrolase superfamily protein
MTYSIVARDPETGELGVAVQSHAFSVGSIVTWGEAGVGVVATQAFAEPSYGPLGLDLMRGGKSADQALDALIAADGMAAVRQVAMIDASGTVAVHTGERTIPEAGHSTADTYSCQANMMLRDGVPETMAAAFGTASGPLPERLLAALDAAEARGGDIRGRQSAALLVVRGERAPNAHAGYVLELRVEDHAEPLDELRRVLRVRRAFGRSADAHALVAKGELDAAAEIYEAVRADLPGNVEPTFWRCVSLAVAGHTDEARAILGSLPDEWTELLRRLPAAGVLAEGVVADVLGKA